jgi:hypothetical protein
MHLIYLVVFLLDFLQQGILFSQDPLLNIDFTVINLLSFDQGRPLFIFIYLIVIILSHLHIIFCVLFGIVLR